MTEKIPACHDKSLECLHQVKDALIRGAFIEAIKHTGDSAELIQNEREWCYDSDETLQAMYNFMIQLGDTLGVLNLLQTNGKHQCELKNELIKHIDSTINELTQVTKNTSRWEKPDENLDFIEKEYRINRYKA